MSSIKYKNRLLLFVDFLAFKEHIEKTETDKSHIEKIRWAMSVLADLPMEKEFFKSQRASQFSDCIVVSYSTKEPSAVFWLVNQVALRILHLAENGFLVRGAITVGKLHHDDRFVFGPALVRAYELESRSAIVPRILVDPEVLTAARRSATHHPDEEEEYVRSFLSKDIDGKEYINYVDWNNVVDAIGADANQYPRYLEDLSSLVRAGLRHPDGRVAKKYLWLQRQLKKSVKRYKGLPASHQYGGIQQKKTRSKLARSIEKKYGFPIPKI